MTKKRVALLASGSGSNVEALLKAMQAPDFPANPVLVFSNRPDAGVLARARAFGVPTAALDHKKFDSRESFDTAVVGALEKAEAELICLAGYMRIVTPVLLNAFQGRILNIHPALLPKHGGAGMFGHHVHEAVLAAGDSESGATVHWVTEEVDAGAIVLQAKVPVLPGDSAEDLAARVLETEHQLYPAALAKVCGPRA